ncbi:hydroxyacid dehydrogenase [Streptomyces sp. BH055]|uniref:hydroxyacid dehydrogenase n=1 Tax=Streptomyces sp. BH055 TaxID=3401173 RepID=UPI003BB6F504
MTAVKGASLNSIPAAPARRPHTLLAMGADIHAALLAEGALDRLAAAAQADTARSYADLAQAPADELAATEVLFTHWGCTPLTTPLLRRMPRLRAVVHAAGSVKHHVTDAVWRRGIAVSSAAAANARPVAEYTVAAILFANKRVLDSARTYQEHRGRFALLPYFAGAGNHGRTVGVVGASRTGRLVLELLRPFDLEVLVHDPFLDAAGAAALGAEQTNLDDLVRRSHVVTIHAPQLPETRHLFDARRLSLLRDGGTLINTARGSLVDTAALTAELLTGRISAVLDVTEPEVPAADSPLYGLPNVLMTPHMAGSLGNELGRMADAATAELERYARGEPFAHAVAPDELARSA